MAKKMDGPKSKSDKKKVIVKSLQRTTKKLSDVQTINKRPLDTSVPSKKDMIRKVNTKMAENAYDSGLLRYNRGGQDNPTPYPRVESSKKPKLSSKIVGRLKKK